MTTITPLPPAPDREQPGDDYAETASVWAAALGDMVDEFNTLLAGSTSFPVSPNLGDKHYRSDRNLWYYYDGTQWLSTTLYTLNLAFQASLNPVTGTSNELNAANPFYNSYAIYITDTVLAGYNTATTSANYFAGQFKRWVGATSTNIGSSVSQQNDTQNAFISHVNSVNATVPSTAQAITCSFTRTGTPSTYLMASVNYRLIG